MLACMRQPRREEGKADNSERVEKLLLKVNLAEIRRGVLPFLSVT